MMPRLPLVISVDEYIDANPRLRNEVNEILEYSANNAVALYSDLRKRHDEFVRWLHEDCSRPLKMRHIDRKLAELKLLEKE